MYGKSLERGRRERTRPLPAPLVPRLRVCPAGERLHEREVRDAGRDDAGPRRPRLPSEGAWEVSAAARIVDRYGWSAGPWSDEPDRWEGEHEGFPLLALRNQMGAWCGYAAMPLGHPWHGKDAFRDVDVDVHGGLTYGDKCSGNICHVPKPGEPDDVWWLGFDCNHSGDVSPGMEAMEGEHWWLRAREHFASYKSLDYVQRECQRLAEQAKAAVAHQGKDPSR